MNDDYALMMTELPLLRGFTVAGAQMLLESGEIRNHAPGELLFREGDPPTFVVLVLTGKLHVFVERKGQEVALNEVGPGCVLGELAVERNLPRSASAGASEPTVAVHWSSDAFRRLLLRHTLFSERVHLQSLDTLLDSERARLDSPGQPADKGKQ
jgi:CRP/FNR family transcriptional regulator, cyclic AMP receptor protein